MRFTLTDQNQVAGALELPFVNKGSGPATSAQLELIAGSKSYAGSSPQDIAGGEMRSFVQYLTFREAAEIAQTAAPLKVHLTYGGRDTVFSFAFSGEALTKFFAPWNFAGWEERQLDEKTVSISRKFVVPEELADLGLQFAVDIGELWGSVSVNGKPTLTRFSGDSGELWLTSNARAHDSYDIVLTVKSDKPIRGNVLAFSSLRPRQEVIEKYLLNPRFAKEIYKIDLGDQASVVSKIVELLQSHNLQALDEILEPVNERIARFVPDAKQLSLHLVGNAHIDMAWLWRYTETIEVTRATFQSALDNLKWYPDFRFSHGQAHSYQWIEQRYPDMFRQIQEYVRSGRWEIVGGTWVESDANIPSGESLVRQYLYGKRYFKQKFGVEVKHGFYPDTFGHTATLPQILSKSGIDTYTFFRPWEDERIFWWECPDGSRVLAHHPSNWYGTWSGIPDTLWTAAVNTHEKFGISDAIQFFGVGDHGGGPTRRQIEQIEQLSKVDLYPKTEMSSFDAYYQKLLSKERDAEVHRGELNPAFEGCYTSQAMIKKNNRKAEALLPTAELFSAIATKYGYDYPGDEFTDAWHKVLFNQFHDILCGSGIHEVYADAEQFYADAFDRAGTALHGALRAIAVNISTDSRVKQARPFVLFNPLNWKRSEPVEMMVRNDADQDPKIIDERGKEIPVQIIERRPDSAKVVFLANGIPSVGYRTYWIASRKQGNPRQANDLVLENRFFRVEIDSVTGSVARIYDKLKKREVLQRGKLGNQLQIQEDDTGMSAWVIGLHGEAKAINAPSTVRVLESGKVRKIVRSEYVYEKSTFTQDVVLYADYPRIDFRFSADWQHRKRILKIAFPLSVSGGNATFEIPFGAIERPSDGHEVVAQKWVDVSNAEYGVSLLNDSKYGFDVKDGVIRMTALRSSTDPDPKADEGAHEFSYALYPHSGRWQEAQTVLRGYEFNTLVVILPVEQHVGSLPSSFSFMQFGNPSVVLTAVKKCEDDKNLIVRCYEATGKSAQERMRLWQPIARIQETDLIEWNPKPVSREGSGDAGLSFNLRPGEIKTFLITLGKEQ